MSLNQGFEEKNQVCVDINECLATNPCPSKSRCRNTHGNFVCDDINECVEGTHDCVGNETCSNMYNGHMCKVKVDSKCGNILLFNCMITLGPPVTCIDLAKLGTLRHGGYSYTFERETIWRGYGRNKKKTNLGYVKSSRQDGDRIIKTYNGDDFSLGCQRITKLTYECGDETRLTAFHEVTSCNYEIYVVVNCNKIC